MRKNLPSVMILDQKMNFSGFLSCANGKDKSCAQNLKLPLLMINYCGVFECWRLYSIKSIIISHLTGEAHKDSPTNCAWIVAGNRHTNVFFTIEFFDVDLFASNWRIFALCCLKRFGLLWIICVLDCQWWYYLFRGDISLFISLMGMLL